MSYPGEGEFSFGNPVKQQGAGERRPTKFMLTFLPSALLHFFILFSDGLEIERVDPRWVWGEEFQKWKYVSF